MKILHYTVGLSEFRGGGLTKYVDDLTMYQSENNDVVILYPGEFNLFNKSINIKKEKSKHSISIYSVINPLGLPMMFGLKDDEYLVKKSPLKLWKEFLVQNSIELIHIHTLIGLYEEFIDAANELNIPMIYTTHDYFGLCPKQTFVYNHMNCQNWKTCTDCPKCNQSAFSKRKTFIIHSKLFCKMRKNKLFLIAKSKAKSSIDNIDENTNKKELNDVSFYVELKNKNIEMFKKIDWFHFNSSISQKVFLRDIPELKGEVLNIAHGDILDHRSKKSFEHNKLHISYLGPATEIKGFVWLINTLDEVYKKNSQFILNIFTYTSLERNYIVKHGNSYNYSQLAQIMKETDVLIVPSIWFETFGFTTLEALSYGVPVIISDTVGAKDLIQDGVTGFIINRNNFKNKIHEIINDRTILNKMNENILDSNFDTFEVHCKKIDDMYKKIYEEKKEKN